MQSRTITHPTAFNLEWTCVFCGLGVRYIRRTWSKYCLILLITGVAGTRALRWVYCLLVVVRPHLIVFTGLYVNLFILAVFTLYRLKTAGRKVLLVACCTMFILGTTEIILLISATAIYICILQTLVKSGANLGQAAFPANFLDGLAPLGLAEDIIFAINKSVNRLSTVCVTNSIQFSYRSSFR